jgi:hypothetical protein
MIEANNYAIYGFHFFFITLIFILVIIDDLHDLLFMIHFKIDTAVHNCIFQLNLLRVIQ